MHASTMLLLVWQGFGDGGVVVVPDPRVVCFRDESLSQPRLGGEAMSRPLLGSESLASPRFTNEQFFTGSC